MPCRGCNGECGRITFPYKTRKNIGRMPVEEAVKYKRCVKCERFIQTNNRNCPCCGIHMRHFPHHKTGNRQKYKEMRQASIASNERRETTRHDES